MYRHRLGIDYHDLLNQLASAFIIPGLGGPYDFKWLTTLVIWFLLHACSAERSKYLTNTALVLSSLNAKDATSLQVQV